MQLFNVLLTNGVSVRAGRAAPFQYGGDGN